MFVGILSLELYFPGSGSLKSKRFVLRSIKDRLKKLNVSVAEEPNNLWQKSMLTVACVANDKTQIFSTFETVQKMVLSNGEVELLNSQMEIL
ncbi:MAG: DUF503 domain-containing protein [Nitrospirae bacterium]|nr:MAG: DUF503 domain-containing protein [Nitrospirota bacterium]